MLYKTHSTDHSSMTLSSSIILEHKHYSVQGLKWAFSAVYTLFQEILFPSWRSNNYIFSHICDIYSHVYLLHAITIVHIKSRKLLTSTILKDIPTLFVAICNYHPLVIC